MTARKTTPSHATDEARCELDARRCALKITCAQLAGLVFLSETMVRQALGGQRPLKVTVARGLTMAIDMLERYPNRIVNKRPGIVTNSRVARLERENFKRAAVAAACPQ